MTTINRMNTSLSGQVGAGKFAAGTSINTWVPTISFNIAGDLSVSYVTQQGIYMQIGNIIVASFTLIFTPTYTTTAGSARIMGLPVASFSHSNYEAVGQISISTVDAFPTSRPSAMIVLGSDTTNMNISFSGTSSANQNWSVTQILSGNQLSLTGTITYLS